MGEEWSDRILTFKFNYNMLFLTTKVLQILLVLVWSESWTFWSEESFLVAVTLALLDLTRFTWSGGHISKAGLSETTRCLENKCRSLNGHCSNVQNLNSQQSVDLETDVSCWYLWSSTGCMKEDRVNNCGHLLIVWCSVCVQREGGSAWFLVSDPKWKDQKLQT